MATTTDLTTLKINYLSQSQYDNALANNQINSDELYFTPADDGVTINLNGQNVQSPSFYAPTDSGTAGNFLKSGGSNVAPTWAALTSSEVTTALGFTPYNSTNPNGYTTNTGTVTSVQVQATSPVVSSVNTAQTGTLNTTISLANNYGDTKNPYASKTKNYILAAPSSANGTPSFRALVADDIPTLSITDKTSGTLTVARGGTGVTSFGINSVIIGNASTTSGALTYAASKSGALYSTGDNVTPKFGTLPVAQGGTGNTSQTANRLIYSESATKLSSSGHYASLEKVAINSTAAPTENFYVNGTTCLNGSLTYNYGTANRLMYTDSNKIVLAGNHYVNNTKVAIYSTTEPTENFYVNGTSRFALGTGSSDDLTSTKKFLVGSSGKRYLSIGGAGFQAYDENDAVSILHLNYNGGSVRVNYGVSSSNANSELLVKGRVVVDTSYHNTNSFSEFRINRSTGGWSAITLGGAQGTVSGAGLGVWLIGNKDTPANATTAAASITDSQFYISYNGSNSAACRIQGHNATGFSIRPRLAVNTDVNTSYNFYVNGTAAISDTLYLTRTTDASGTADNKPALMIGSSTGQHIEIDGNEILSKSNTTTPGTLYLQDDTGSVAVAGSGGLTVSSLTASQAVSTDANKKLVSTNLSVSDPSASGSGITYIATISQSATGKITATKSTVRDASTSQSGIVSTGTQQFKGRKGFGYLNLYAEDAGTAKRYIDIIGYNNAGTQIAEIYYDAGNTTNITTGIWRFKEFSPHSTADTTTTGFYEYYSLPVVAKDLTANQGYNILTSKSAVTIAQGGTGATTRLAAAKNLTSENVTSPDYVVSLTQSWANFGYTSIANLKTTLGINAGSMVQSQYLVREGTGTTSYSMTFNFAPDIIISLTSGSTDFMIDSYQGILVSGAYNFNNNMVFMRFVPTGTYESALSNTAEDYTTGDFFSGIQFAPPMIKSGLFANYFPYYVNGNTFTFNPNENSGGVLHQKSSNGKTYYLKAVSNTYGVAYAQTILNSSGVKYAFLALKFM